MSAPIENGGNAGIEPVGTSTDSSVPSYPDLLKDVNRLRVLAYNQPVGTVRGGRFSSVLVEWANRRHTLLASVARASSSVEDISTPSTSDTKR